MARLINYDVVDSVTTPALIGYVRRFISRLQKTVDVDRYVYLPDDPVWWARIVSNKARRGQVIVDNIKEALDFQTPGRASTLSAFAYVGDETGLTPGQLVKRRILEVYVKLVSLTMASRDYANLRATLLQSMANRRDAFFDIEMLAIADRLNEAITAAAQAYAITTVSLAVSDPLRITRLLEIMRDFFIYAQDWTPTTNFYLSTIRHVGNVALTKMATVRSDSKVGRVTPTRADALTDLLIFLFVNQWFVSAANEYELTPVENRVREIINRKVSNASLQTLFDWVTSAGMHEEVHAWINHLELHPRYVYKFCAHAASVLMELMRTDDKLVTCYMHIVDGRFKQMGLPENPTFVYPSPVDYPIQDAVRFVFLHGRTYYVKRAALYAMRYAPDPLQKLGAGSNGAVFVSSADETVAVKMTDVFFQHEYDLQVEAGLAGFGPETYSLMRIEDVKRREDGKYSFGNLSFIASQRMGKTMEYYLEHAETLEELMDIVDVVIDFLQDLAEQGNFIHHDMKPDNIMTIHGMDPYQRSSWRVIDFGFSWYGGRDFDPRATTARKDCMPYGWNRNTSTLDVPRIVYTGWIRTAPPALIRSWDVFCMLLYLCRESRTYTQLSGKSDEFEEYVLRKMYTFVEDDPDTYSITSPLSSMNDAVRVFLMHDYAEYESEFDTLQHNQVKWRRSTNYHEHIHNREDGRVRMFIRKMFMSARNLSIFNYIGSHYVEDNAFACCVMTECDATIKFTPHSQNALRDQSMMQLAASKNLTGTVFFAVSYDIGIIFETHVIERGTRSYAVTAVSGSAHDLVSIFDAYMQDASTPDIFSEICSLIDRAFDYVRDVDAAGFVHHDLTVHTLLYDTNDNTFTIRNFVRAWHDSVGEYPGSFEVAPGQQARTPLKSIMYARLFVSLYKEIIIRRVKERSRALAFQLANYMRTSVLSKYVSVFPECRKLQTTDDETSVSLRYTFEDVDGQMRTINL